MNAPPWLDDRLAANGLPVHDNFARWFGASQAVDLLNLPRTFFHGSPNALEDSEAFEADRPVDLHTKDAGWYGSGIYFTADPEAASAYASYEELAKPGGGLEVLRGPANDHAPRVIPVFLSLQNPYRWPEGRRAALGLEESKAIRIELEEQGFDGVMVPNAYADPSFSQQYEVVVFRPEQIKSAIGNSGLYVRESPSLTDFVAPGIAHRISLARSQLTSKTMLSSATPSPARRTCGSSPRSSTPP